MKYFKTFEDFLKPEGNEVTEMGLHDWKVELLLAAYNKADEKGKADIADKVTGDKKANLAKITKGIRSLDKDELDEIVDELGLDESTKDMARKK